MIHFNPLVLILRLTFLALIALGFTFCVLGIAAVWSFGMDQVFGLWGGGCGICLFVFAAMVHDALEVA